MKMSSGIVNSFWSFAIKILLVSMQTKDWKISAYFLVYEETKICLYQEYAAKSFFSIHGKIKMYPRD